MEQVLAYQPLVDMLIGVERVVTRIWLSVQFVDNFQTTTLDFADSNTYGVDQIRGTSMSGLIKTKSIIFGLSLILLGGILACGEGATPTPDAQPTQDVAAIVQQVLAQQEQPDALAAADIQQLVQGVVTQALSDQPAPEGLTAQQVQDMVQQAIAAAVQPGASALEVQTAIAAAVGAIESGISAEDVQAVVQQAVTAALGTAGPTPAPGAMMEPSGTLDVSIGDLGEPIFNLSAAGFTQTLFDNSLPTHEAMFATAPDGTTVPRLVTNWSVDASGLVFTFNLQQGVPWQKQYGLWGAFNADDFIFSMERISIEGAVASSSGSIRRLFTCDECELVKLGDHTVRLTRPSPTFEITWWSQQPLGGALAFHSKNHFEAAGEEVANGQSVGTGPWELVEAKTEEFKRARAVSNHWRKTPEWEQMIWWDIKEETTRLANFQAGLLDSGSFSADSIQAIKNQNDPEIKFMAFAGAFHHYINIMGMQHHLDAPSHLPGADGEIAVPVGDDPFDCSIAYVSCDSDTSSTEWVNARKVREAMSYAIDREALVNNLVFGAGNPWWISWWIGHEGRMQQFGLDQLQREFDPALASQLLVEAGYPSGVEIDVNLQPGFHPGNADTLEAVTAMWDDVGIRTVISRQPYGTFRPTLVRRTAKAVLNVSDSPTIEPIRTYNVFFNPKSSLNFGFEHPDFTALLEEASVLVDTEARWAKSAKAAKWIFDNVMHLSAFQVNSTWPLGPELDPWEVQGLKRDWLSNWEFAPHRQ